MRKGKYLNLIELFRNTKSVEFEYQFRIGKKYSYYADIYVKEKCILSQLNNKIIPPHTIIELKERLLFDTLSRYKKLFEENKKEWGVNYFYIIYKESRIPLQFFQQYTDEHFQVYSIDEFLSEQHRDNYYYYYYYWNEDNDKIIDQAHDAVMQSHVTLFLGAGVSLDAGLPAWDTLLKDLLNKYQHKMTSPIGQADYSNVTSQCANSSIITARYIRVGLELSSKDYEFIQMIHQSLYQHKAQSHPLIDAIAKAVQKYHQSNLNYGIESIITYNYDDLVEQALSKQNVKNISIYESNRGMQNEFPIYHVHGILSEQLEGKDAPTPTAILCEEDYHEIYKEAYLWSNIEQLHALNRNTCFFIGCSMTDPNLRRLLDISQKRTDGKANHFVFMQKKPFTEASSNEQNEENRKIQQQILNEMGLNVIWFNDFSDIPKLIHRIFC